MCFVDLEKASIYIYNAAYHCSNVAVNICESISAVLRSLLQAPEQHVCHNQSFPRCVLSLPIEPYQQHEESTAVDWCVIKIQRTYFTVSLSHFEENTSLRSGQENQNVI